MNSQMEFAMTLDQWIRSENAHGRSPNLAEWPNKEEVEEYLKRLPAQSPPPVP